MAKRKPVGSKLLIAAVAVVVFAAGYVALLGRQVGALKPSASQPASSGTATGGLSLYASPSLGFAMLIPDQVAMPGCVPNPRDGAFISGPDAEVPVKGFESGGTAVFTQRYYYQLLDPVGGSRPQNEYETCRRVEASADIPALPDGAQSTATYWQVRVASVGDADDLSAFVWQSFGSACTVGAQTPTAYPGTFDVALEGQGTDSGAVDCYPGRVALKYSPVQHIAAAWKRGQTASFVSSSGVQYDDDMAASFRFL